MNETDNQIRAKEAVTACQSAEVEASKALTNAVESTKRARERYEAIFLAEEQAECARLRSTYNHCTK